MLLMVLGPTASLLFALNALVFASLAIYTLALCVQLSVAVISLLFARIRRAELSHSPARPMRAPR